MKAFIGVDIQECLRRVVEENTLYHKADFEYDIGDLKNAISVLDSKNFLWVSRESGTYCFQERDVYLTPSYANNTWLYYRGHPEEIKAFYGIPSVKTTAPIPMNMTALSSEPEKRMRLHWSWSRNRSKDRSRKHDGV